MCSRNICRLSGVKLIESIETVDLGLIGKVMNILRNLIVIVYQIVVACTTEAEISLEYSRNISNLTNDTSQVNSISIRSTTIILRRTSKSSYNLSKPSLP